MTLFNLPDTANPINILQIRGPPNNYLVLLTVHGLYPFCLFSIYRITLVLYVLIHPVPASGSRFRQEQRAFCSTVHQRPMRAGLSTGDITLGELNQRKGSLKRNSARQLSRWILFKGPRPQPVPNERERKKRSTDGQGDTFLPPASKTGLVFLLRPLVHSTTRGSLAYSSFSTDFFSPRIPTYKRGSHVPGRCSRDFISTSTSRRSLCTFAVPLHSRERCSFLPSSR